MSSSLLLLISIISSPIVKLLFGMLNLGVGNILYSTFEILLIFILLLIFKLFFIDSTEKLNNFGALK